MKRSEQRRLAVVALYQHEVTGRPLDELLESDARPFTRALAHAAHERRGELDEVIARHAQGWTIDRIAPLEKAIMRVALTEALHPEELPAERPIPVAAAIDEAVELAKRYCGADAPGFVNGVLGAAVREDTHS